MPEWERVVDTDGREKETLSHDGIGEIVLGLLFVILLGLLFFWLFSAT